MPPNAAPAHEEVFFVKDTIDAELPEQDGFESHVFTVGEYNKAVGEPFKLPHDPDSAAILIISTPNMFDVSFKRWFLMKCKEFGSVEAVAENVSSPIQEFLQYRLEPLCKKFDDLDVEYELLHDHSLWANRKPKILMQTCGHISGAAFYYQPFQVGGEGWPPYLPKGKKKFIGLSLHPIYGGHFAFRSVFIFPKLRLVDFCAPKPLSILHSQEEIRDALERFNYSWQDSGFRDFGCPLKRYSTTQMEFFGVPPSERWEILRQWYEEP